MNTVVNGNSQSSEHRKYRDIVHQHGLLMSTRRAQDF